MCVKISVNGSYNASNRNSLLREIKKAWVAAPDGFSGTFEIAPSGRRGKPYLADFGKLQTVIDTLYRKAHRRIPRVEFSRLVAAHYTLQYDGTLPPIDAAMVLRYATRKLVKFPE